MTTKRFPVDLKNVNWYDGLRVTRDEMRDEQTRNIGIDASNVANFLGSGIVEESSESSIIFDTNSLNSQQQTLLSGNTFDGNDIYIGSPLTAVSDQTMGVQLSVTLSDVQLSGAATTKVCIIGDTFGDLLIHDDLLFNENGTKITRGRYKNIRAILFNDFAGNLYGSRGNALDILDNLTGRCVIREAKAMEVSYDHIIASQTAQPNKFFDDFHPGNPSDTLTTMLQSAIGPDKSVSDLNIGIESFAKRNLDPGDVTTKIGQKFIANGTNIQKISVLLSVKEDTSVPPMDAYDWSGSIALTLHELQTDVSCPLAPIPDNAADFDPNPSIVAQLTLDKEDIEYQGVVLGSDPQIVDFIFTGNKIADPVRSPIQIGKYYAFTVSRSGDAIIGTLLLEEAPHRAENGYLVVYDGTQWINVKESDMWFGVEGDYIKVSDGIAYEEGVGVEIPRIKKDSTNTEVPYIEGFLPFYTTTRNTSNYVLLEQQSEFSDPEQDQRTGNQVFARYAPSPSISLINQTSLNSIIEFNPIPILLGNIQDKNPRGNPTSISGTTNLPGLAVGNEFNILLPNADLINNNLVGSILIPDTSKSNKYRIIEAEFISDAYGDVSGDGIIDAYDLSTVDSWFVKWSTHVPIDLSDGYIQSRIYDGHLNVLDFLRADVRNDDDGDYSVGASDAAVLSNYINKNIVSFPAGSTFSRLRLKVENILDPLATVADIPADNSNFTTVLFSPLNWRIDYFATWMPDLLIVEDLRRDMPTTFTDSVSEDIPSGRNNFYVPGNIIINDQMQNPDGTPYSIDFEFTQFSLDIPITDSYGNPTFLDGYIGILLFDTFVAESANGKTAEGFSALKYSDKTYVQIGDFDSGMVKISPAIQSLANEYQITFGGSIKDIVGMHYNPTNSLMVLYIKDLYDDTYGNILKSLSTKIVVSVYLKRAGFANVDTEVTRSQMRNLLGI